MGICYSVNNSINITKDEAKEFLFKKCKFPPSIFDGKGTFQHMSHTKNKSGPPGYLKDYKPPNGWTQIGLKVANIYDNEDNDWIGINNNFGEWYVCYLGFNSIKDIYNKESRKGDKQHF